MIKFQAKPNEEPAFSKVSVRAPGSSVFNISKLAVLKEKDPRPLNKASLLN